MKQNFKFSSRKHLILFLIASSCFFNISPVSAQDAYKALKANVILTGTSTLHNWEMTAADFTCNSIFQLENNKITEVKSLTLTIAVKTLKSGKNAMDKNAYAALKAGEFKQITYVINTSTVVGNKIICTGSLTIAGVTKPIEVESIYTANADHTITCKTSKTFKMSEFNVDPPSFMFGTVTTGDEITMTFDLTFKKS